MGDEGCLRHGLRGRSGYAKIATGIDFARRREYETSIPVLSPAPDEVTVVSWTTPLRNSIGDYWFKFLDVLKKLDGPGYVRIVFGFDS